MSKFSQSGNNFYSTIAQNRPDSTNDKYLRGRISSTGQSFLPYNTITNFRPSTGMSNRSSSSSLRNTTGKLQTLRDNLSHLLEDCKQTRIETKQLQLHLNFAKEESMQRGIIPLQMNLIQQIKLLEKKVTISKRSDLLRFEALHQTCHALSRNTKDIKANLNFINERLLAIENVLGYHGLRDKLKY